MKRRLLALALVVSLVAFVAVVLDRNWSGHPDRATTVRRTPTGKQRVEAERIQMATLVRIIAYGDAEPASQAIEDAFDRITELEQKLSKYMDGSDVSRVNNAPAGTPVAVSVETWEVLEGARTAWERTGGVFDVTVGPLVQLWSEAGKTGKLPTEEKLAGVAAKVGFDKVRLQGDGRLVTLTVPGMRLDLGGIAKGYVVDEALRTLQSHGVTSALVDAGGDIRVLEPKPEGPPWITAVRNPASKDGRPFITELAVENVAVVTSGDYERYVEIGGRRFTHILDPRTGRPEAEVRSATIIGPDAMSSDALATSLAVLGREDGLKLIESLPEYECLIITGQGKQMTFTRSSGFPRYELNPP